MNGQILSYNEYLQRADLIPDVVMLSETPATKIDLHGVAAYVKKTGKPGHEMTDEELGMFVEDVSIVRDFYARHSGQYQKAK